MRNLTISRMAIIFNGQTRITVIVCGLIVWNFLNQRSVGMPLNCSLHRSRTELIECRQRNTNDLKGLRTPNYSSP